MTHLPPMHWSRAMSAIVAAALLLVDLLVHTIRRGGRRRLGRSVVSSAETEIADALAWLPPQGARVVLQTIALHAQTLTGAEHAAAGIGGDGSHPFAIWTHIGPPTGEFPPASPSLFFPTRANLLAVPIRFRGHVVGCLCLGNKHGGGEFTFEDQHMAEMLAARACGALETARMHAAEGRAHAWLQSVLDQMPEGILVVDSRGRVTLRNRQLPSFMDVPPTGVDRLGAALTVDLRFPSGERLSSDDLPIVRALVDREVIVGHELLARREDDRLVPLLVSAAPILMSDGSVAGAVLLCQDISTIREFQRLREEWASIVAHDLRQPISVIALRSSLLLRGPLSIEQRDCVEHIASSVHSLGRMVSDLMQASLLESDRLRVTLDRLDLAQLLRDVVRRTPASARIRTEIPSDLCLFVKGDAQRLEQVIENLISNAVKYSEPETEIGVSLDFEAAQAHIRVTNVGDGIPADELPFIFNRFTRARGADARGIKGLGLGLYIAKGLVAAHHGRIWAESAAGDCTTFHVTLPTDGPPRLEEPPSLAFSAPSFAEESS